MGPASRNQRKKVMETSSRDTISSPRPLPFSPQSPKNPRKNFRENPETILKRSWNDPETILKNPKWTPQRMLKKSWKNFGENPETILKRSWNDAEKSQMNSPKNAEKILKGSWKNLERILKESRKKKSRKNPRPDPGSLKHPGECCVESELIWKRTYRCVHIPSHQLEGIAKESRKRKTVFLFHFSLRWDWGNVCPSYRLVACSFPLFFPLERACFGWNGPAFPIGSRSARSLVYHAFFLSFFLFFFF